MPQRHQDTKKHKDNLVGQITQIFLKKLCLPCGNPVRSEAIPQGELSTFVSFAEGITM